MSALCILEKRFSPGTRILILLVLVSGTATISIGEWESLLVLGPLALAAAFAAGLSARNVAFFAFVMIPFVLLVMLQLFAGGSEGAAPVVAGPVTLYFHPSRIGFVAVVVARSLVALIFAVSLAEGIKGEEFADFLAAARVPAFLVMSLTVMLNYARRFRTDMDRLFAAARMREPSRAYTGRVVLAARSVGMIFLRALERSERLHAAMLARGCDGTPAESRVSAGIDPAAVALAVLIVAGARLVAGGVSI